jgi:hypothetical protein
MFVEETAKSDIEARASSEFDDAEQATMTHP